MLVLGLFWLARSWTCEHEHEHLEAEPRVPLEVHIM
jgi:hypothetical protein